jgi:hypothetical protein
MVRAIAGVSRRFRILIVCAVLSFMAMGSMVAAAPSALALGPGEVCMFNAPNALDPVGLIGHVAWGYLVGGTSTWVYGSYGDGDSWHTSGSAASMFATFANQANYTRYRCVSTPTSAVGAANNMVSTQFGVGYNVANHNCLTVSVLIYKAYAGSLSSLPSGVLTQPNSYFYNTLTAYDWWPVTSL